MWFESTFRPSHKPSGAPGEPVVPGLPPVLPAAYEHRSDCVCTLLPAVRRSVSRFGYNDTIVALVSLAVYEAIRWRRPAAVARLLLENGRMLEEAELHMDAPRPHEPPEKR